MKGYHAGAEELERRDWDKNRLAFAGRPPHRGLIAHWKLDEETGTVFKDSAGLYALDGTLIGGTPDSRIFKINRGLFFDGVDDYISVPDELHIDFDFRADSMSLAFWFKADATITNLARWIAKEAGTAFYRIRFDTTGGQYRIAFALKDQGGVTTEVFYNATILLVAGLTFHVVATYNAATDVMRLYVDGVQQATGTFTPASSTKTTGAILALGADSAGTNPYKGILDDVRIYDRELTAQEVLVLKNWGADDDPDQPTVAVGTPTSQFKTWENEPRGATQ